MAVGVTSGEDVAADYMSVQQVWDAIDRGEGFYTHANGKSAWVRKFYCACGLGSLRSEADATTANNLDSLRLCRFAA